MCRKKYFVKSRGKIAEYHYEIHDSQGRLEFDGNTKGKIQKAERRESTRNRAVEVRELLKSDWETNVDSARELAIKLSYLLQGISLTIYRVDEWSEVVERSESHKIMDVSTSWRQ